MAPKLNHTRERLVAATTRSALKTRADYSLAGRLSCEPLLADDQVKRFADVTFRWRFQGVVANNSRVETHEGANENDLALLRSGVLLCIFRVDAGDGEGCARCDSASSGCRGPCQPFNRSLSTDLGCACFSAVPCSQSFVRAYVYLCICVTPV